MMSGLMRVQISSEPFFSTTSVRMPI